DAVGRRGANCRVIAVTDRVIVLHDSAQRREREKVSDHRRAVRAPDVEHEARSANAQMQRKRTLVVAVRGKGIVFAQIIDRDGRLVLDVGIRPADGIFVERHRDEAVLLSLGRALRAYHRGLKRIITERACPSSPSASPKAIAAGPSARNWSGPPWRIDVRFMKSSTLSPEQNRAERAVGSTWFEPAT